MKETSIKGYCINFAILLGLAVVNIFLANVDLHGWNTGITITIASVQAFILAAFFMHLRESTRFTWVIVFSGFFFVAVLAIYVVCDNLGRASQTQIMTWEQHDKITLPARTGGIPAPTHAPAK